MLPKLENILLFLSISFLPTQLGRHFWPQFSYIYSLRIDYLSPSIYFWDLLVFGLIFIWKLSGGKFRGHALNFFLIFILSQGLSLFGSQNIGAGLFRLEQYLTSGLFGVYLASQNWNDLNKKLFLPLLISYLFEATLAVGQFLKSGSLGFWIFGERAFTISTPAIAKFDFYGRQFLRPYGTFPHPNVLAAFIIIVPVILSKILKFRIRFWTPLGLTILASLVTVLSVSRVAILAGFMEAFILLSKKWRILLLAAVLILSPVIFTRFTALFNYDNLAFIRREELSVIAWDLFISLPLTGVGLNNFIPASSEGVISGPSRFLQPVHNIFLLSLAETGILGLLGLLGLLGYPITELFKLRTTNYLSAGRHGQLRTLLLIWGVIIFLGLFDHYFLTLPQGYRLLFLVWGISLSRDHLGIKKV